MKDPIWITTEHATTAHRRQLAEHGGLDGIRDPSLLESALGLPRHQFAYAHPTPSIPALAAAYAYAIAKNHPFLDGNKRTAAVLCESFLLINGLTIDATDEELYPLFYNLAAGTLSQEDLTTFLTTHSHPTVP